VVETGCGPGAEPDPADLDAETRKELEDIKRRAKTSRATTTWSLGTDGVVTVTLRSGDKALVDPTVLKPHVLWR
jgi:hypothetical protein